MIDGDKNVGKPADEVILSDDPLVLYLQNEPYFYLEMPGKAQAWRHVHSKRRDFFLKNGLVLAVPLTIGGQCVGLIGLGSEYTGGRYGHDDFDLMASLKTRKFPGGPLLRRPSLIAGMLFYSLRDRLGR